MSGRDLSNQTGIQCKNKISSFGKMAGKCDIQQKICKLSNLLQREKHLRAEEHLKATERENAHRTETDSLKETINQHVNKFKTLEAERDILLQEADIHTATLKDIIVECHSEKAEQQSITKERDVLQKEVQQLKLQLQRESELHAQEQLRHSEQVKVLRKDICDLQEQLQRECADSFVPELDELQESDSLVQKDSDVCAQEEPKTSEGNNVLHKDNSDLVQKGSDSVDMFDLLLNALVRENLSLFSPEEQVQMTCRDSSLSKKDKAETAEDVTVIQPEDKNQDPADVKEKLQTEISSCLDMLELILEALEREDKLLNAQTEELQTSCKEKRVTFKDVPEKNEAQQVDEIQDPASLLQKENGLCTQEETMTSEGENDFKCQNMLNHNLRSVESQNNASSDEVEQLKMRFECTAEKYQAERKEKEFLQNKILELNIKLRNQMDVYREQQLKASEREKVLCQEINDLRQTIQKGRDEDSELQAWEKEKKAYLEEIEDLKLCYEGKTLRFQDMFQKLKAEKDHKEAIKEEQFKRIQALNLKVKEQLDFCIQQKIWFSEREQMVSLKLEELEGKLLRYEKEVRPEDTNGFNAEVTTDDEASGSQKKKKKCKGWKKFAGNIKPWHWGKK